MISVQQTIEEALEKLTFEGDPYPRLHCAGRTDTGVHGLGQVAHVDLGRNMEEEKLLRALNFHLKGKMTQIIACKNLGENSDFHARFQCQQRSYIYKIINRLTPLTIEKDLAWQYERPLNEDQMQKVAQWLVGCHDLSSFRAAGCQADSPIRTIDKIEVVRHQEKVEILIQAPSFLYHQVRNIVGTLVYVGDGRYSEEDFQKLIKQKDRNLAPPTAPAAGLYFLKATYE